MPQRVAEQVVEHLLKPLGIAVDRGHVAGLRHLQRHSLCLRLGRKAGDDARHQAAQIHGRHIQRDLAGLGQGEIAQIVHQSLE